MDDPVAALNITETLTSASASSLRGMAAPQFLAALWALLVDTFWQLTGNHHVSDLIKYVFLGSIIETGRQIGQRVLDMSKRMFVFEASFEKEDFAYDWVVRYLSEQKTWSRSRVFRVRVANPFTESGMALGSTSTSSSTDNKEKPKDKDGKVIDDGRPKQMYHPAPDAPVFLRWRGYWITVNMDLGQYNYSSGSYGSVLTMSVWSSNRKVLDDFVEAAREAYYAAEDQPPRQLTVIPDISGTAITARFTQADRSFDWMLAWIRANEAFETATHLEVTTKRSEMFLTGSENLSTELVSFKPMRGSKQRVFWNGNWYQVEVNEVERENDRYSYYGNSNLPNGTIEVTVYNSKRSLITDLILAARQEYSKYTVSKVTIHLSSPHGWGTNITKSRRSLQSLILPPGVKEMLLEDIQGFLQGEEWYKWGGVPHKRGYLLYGEPGTGKSSTVHAVASELGLEIYYIQLGTRGMDDTALQTLLSQAPARCILLLEDIDCAFTSRIDDEAQQQNQGMGMGMGYGQPEISHVTFSGLLNCLDSVISGEGRIVFATTNHIEKLDSALVRPGRMDMKIEYRLASRYQMAMTFERLYDMLVSDSDDNASPSQEKGEDSPSTESSADSPTEPISPPSSPPPSSLPPSLASAISFSGASPFKPPRLTSAELATLAEQFADQVPEDKLSLAQIQEFLIRHRGDPRRAVGRVKAWLEEMEEDKRKMEELKKKFAPKPKNADAVEKEDGEEEVKVDIEVESDGAEEEGKAPMREVKGEGEMGDLVSPALSVPWGRVGEGRELVDVSPVSD